MNLEQKVMADLKTACCKMKKTVRSLRAIQAAIILAKKLSKAPEERSLEETEQKLLQKLVNSAMITGDLPSAKTGRLAKKERRGN